MARLNPYLNFQGRTEEAFSFYRAVFGTEFQMIMRYKDIPAEVPVPEHHPERIMHISLPIGHGTTLMGSDRPDAFGPITSGDNFHISIGADTEQEARRIFAELSKGGKITMPLEKAFWGATFGMITDKFGINWMINHGNHH